ncbi:GNAT family N-acetyltransferase [Streptomyces sp. NPDC048659]|uniref:GNAT family N-acetyltransferase n=1 Tax=Streptomyces sp. NPDC048659 TaxID=3155489 RepID=UPI00341C543D
MIDTVVLRTEPVPSPSPSPSPSALVLRPWVAQDAAAVVEAYRDPVLRRWVRAVPETEADALRWVGEQQRAWAEGTRYAFAVLAADGGAGADGADGAGAAVGSDGAGAAVGPALANVVLKRPAGGGPVAEVGYWTAAPARGLGVAPRALEAVTRWAFATFGPAGLERLELLHQVDNPASCRVAGKSGYAFARILPAAPPDFPLDGHLHLRHRDG